MIRTIDEYYELLLDRFESHREGDYQEFINEFYEEATYYVRVYFTEDNQQYVMKFEGGFDFTHKKSQATRLTKDECVELSLFLYENYGEDTMIELEE